MDSIEGEFNGGLAKELSLGDLCQAEEIMIQTANSIYSFSVTDPVERRGILSGECLRAWKLTLLLRALLCMARGTLTVFYRA